MDRNRSTKHTKEVVLSALKAANGGIYAAAEALGVHYGTIINYGKRWSEVQSVIDDTRNVLLDKCELKLIGLMDSDNEAVALRAVTFFLETVGKERGYTKQRENVISGSLGEVNSEELIARITKRIEAEAAVM